MLSKILGNISEVKCEPVMFEKYLIVTNNYSARCSCFQVGWS